MQIYQIYLDESGDLGWNFSGPYNRGGSSQFLTLAFLFLPPSDRNAPKHLIRSLYRKYNWKNEKKASQATPNQKALFCEKTVKLLKRRPEVKIDVITVKKRNVFPHIRGDANKLYNYMTGLVIPDYIGSEDMVQFIPDERSIKVESGNSLEDYLKIKLWFEHGFRTMIRVEPASSHKNYNLQFVDWIAHCIWSSYENQTAQFLEILRPSIKVRCLYF